LPFGKTEGAWGYIGFVFVWIKKKLVNEEGEKIDVMLFINRNNQSIISRVDLR